ncbi:MAG: DNA repair protein RecN, partial [Planctomycetes bacterium]|nr:DNA repair protein RecN [Planctomycetota bacterium]
LARAVSIRGELDDLDADEQGAGELAEALRAAVAELARIGRRLVRARRKASAPFARAIEVELEALGMPSVRLQVGMADDFAADRVLEESSMHGPVPVEFMVRINPGLPPQSLRDTASGGETARIVLAVKKCLADQDRVPFVAFDEIDAEIGGRLGLAVGRKLAEVAVDHQVLIVTHLPQVAAFADRHFKVSKSVDGGTTRTTIRALDARESEAELAAMAVGEGADGTALAEARRLVERAREAGQSGV